MRKIIVINKISYASKLFTVSEERFANKLEEVKSRFPEDAYEIRTGIINPSRVAKVDYLKSICHPTLTDFCRENGIDPKNLRNALVSNEKVDMLLESIISFYQNKVKEGNEILRDIREYEKGDV